MYIHQHNILSINTCNHNVLLKDDLHSPGVQNISTIINCRKYSSYHTAIKKVNESTNRLYLINQTKSHYCQITNVSILHL